MSVYVFVLDEPVLVHPGYVNEATGEAGPCWLATRTLHVSVEAFYGMVRTAVEHGADVARLRAILDGAVFPAEEA